VLAKLALTTLVCVDLLVAALVDERRWSLAIASQQQQQQQQQSGFGQLQPQLADSERCALHLRADELAHISNSAAGKDACLDELRLVLRADHSSQQAGKLASGEPSGAAVVELPVSKRKVEMEGFREQL